MVDTGNLLAAALNAVVHAERFEQIFRADLHAVAQADGLDTGIAQHVAGQHGHGIRVVQKPCVRADLLHVPRKVGQDGDRPQRAHDPADAQRVADGLAQAELLRDLKVRDGAGVVAADLNGIDDEIRAAQRLFAVFRAKIGGNAGVAALRLVHSGQDIAAFGQTHGINVVKRQLTVPQGLRTHAVAQNIAGKNGASGTHKCNFRHGIVPPLFAPAEIGTGGCLYAQYSAGETGMVWQGVCILWHNVV